MLQEPRNPLLLVPAETMEVDPDNWDHGTTAFSELARLASAIRPCLAQVEQFAALRVLLRREWRESGRHGKSKGHRPDPRHLLGAYRRSSGQSVAELPALEYRQTSARRRSPTRNIKTDIRLETPSVTGSAIGEYT